MRHTFRFDNMLAGERLFSPEEALKFNVWASGNTGNSVMSCWYRIINQHILEQYMDFAYTGDVMQLVTLYKKRVSNQEVHPLES